VDFKNLKGGIYMPKIFSGTYEYYAKYRPGIPEEVINTVVGYFDIKPDDTILDIGCGTGSEHNTS
jgi:ubiquinone/menaquinone biosynthesis C-methylase UbiE